jgi:hypothetical protein
MKIDIIWLKEDESLLNVRKTLRKALVELSLIPAWNEWQVGSPLVPVDLKTHKNLSITVNGHVIYTEKQGESAEIDILVWKEKIERALKQPPKFSFGQQIRFFISILPAIFLAIVPKCPFCWAAYMTAFASFGLPTFAYPTWMFPFFVAFLCINLYVLARMAYIQNNYIPLLFNILGILMIGIGKFVLDNNIYVWLGLGGILFASIWHSRVIRIKRLTIRK